MVANSSLLVSVLTEELHQEIRKMALFCCTDDSVKYYIPKCKNIIVVIHTVVFVQFAC